jgi:hypothetical protein
MVNHSRPDFLIIRTALSCCFPVFAFNDDLLRSKLSVGEGAVAEVSTEVKSCRVAKICEVAQETEIASKARIETETVFSA